MTYDVTIISSASLASAKPMLCFKSADQNNLAFTCVYLDVVGWLIIFSNHNIEFKIILLPSIKMIKYFYFI